MSGKSETHATCTVTRDSNGDIQYIVVRAEFYVVDTELHDNDPDKYSDGVNAKFKFDVRSNGNAELVGVKDINDDAPAGYDTGLDFIRAIPAAEQAVMNVPGVDEVSSTEGHLMALFDTGRTGV